MKKIKEDIKRDDNNSKVGILGIVALVLIAFSFIFLPLLPVFFGNDKNFNIEDLPFGSYKGEKIYYKRDNRFNYYVSYYNSLYSSFNLKDAEYIVWNMSFLNYARELALLDLALKNKFYISREALRERVIKNPLYLDSFGEFSRQRYNKVSEYKRAKIQNDERDLLVTTNIEKILTEELLSSPSLIDNISSMSLLYKDISYLSLAYNDFPLENVLKYAQDNLILFDNLKLDSISFDLKENAELALKKLVENVPFEEVKQLYNDSSIPSVYYYYELESLIDDKRDLEALMNLELNTNSKLIKQKNSKYVIYKILETKNSFEIERDYPIVRAYIEKFSSSLIETYLEEQMNLISREIKDLGLNTVLSKYKLSLSHDKLNLAYKIDFYETTLSSLQDLKDERDFYNIIFSLKEGEWSRVFLNSGKFYLFLLNSTKILKDNGISNKDILQNLNLNRRTLLKEVLLNPKDFKNDFSKVFSKVFFD